MSRIRIGETVYEVQSIERLTIKEALMLEQETAQLGRPLSWAQILAAAADLKGLSREEYLAHPLGLWFTAFLIYTARLRAGEQLTLAEAIDFPIGDLTVLADPEDRASKGPRKARPGTGRAGAAAGRKPARTKT